MKLIVVGMPQWSSGVAYFNFLFLVLIVYVCTDLFVKCRKCYVGLFHDQYIIVEISW